MIPVRCQPPAMTAFAQGFRMTKMRMARVAAPPRAFTSLNSPTLPHLARLLRLGDASRLQQQLQHRQDDHEQQLGVHPSLLQVLGHAQINEEHGEPRCRWPGSRRRWRTDPWPRPASAAPPSPGPSRLPRPSPGARGREHRSDPHHDARDVKHLHPPHPCVGSTHGPGGYPETWAASPCGLLGGLSLFVGGQLLVQPGDTHRQTQPQHDGHNVHVREAATH